VIPRVAGQIKELKHQRPIVAEEVESSWTIPSFPGHDVHAGSWHQDRRDDAPDHRRRQQLQNCRAPRRYAGIAPVTRRSGTSIRGEFPARSGNKQLKNALSRSAWIASRHAPLSKAYYDRKRAEGKKHNAAVICLARRRCDVIYTMLKNGTLYQEKTPQAA
jgi:hypothetical protein